LEKSPTIFAKVVLILAPCALHDTGDFSIVQGDKASTALPTVTGAFIKDSDVIFTDANELKEKTLM
jgi:hypothetical protein